MRGRSPHSLCRLCSGKVTGGLRGAVSPPLWGLGQRPGEIFLDPILGGWTYLWFCAWFLHMVLGSMVFSPWYWMLQHVYICFVNQAGSPSFGIQGKISVYMCFMCSTLALFIFCILEFICW